MNLPLYITKKILSPSGEQRSISRPIVKIAIGGIALGIAVMILTVAIVTGFQQEIRNKVIGFGSHITVASYDNNVSYEPRPVALKQDFIDELKQNPEIAHIQEFATKNGIIKTKTDNEGVLLKGIGSDYNWTFIRNNLKEGTIIPMNDTAISKQIVISNSLAKRLDLKLGQKMLIYFVTKRKAGDTTSSLAYEQRVRDFYVCGIYDSGFEELDAHMVFVDIAQIKKLNYWDKNQTGGFEIEIKDYKKLDKLGDYVYDISGQGLTSQTIKEVNPNIFSWLNLMDTNAVIIIVLMVLIAGINMISALLILILERTNMIGILKALGTSNAGVRKIFLYQAMYLIGRGLLWGNIVGLIITFLQAKYKWIHMPQDIYYIPYVPINLEWVHVLLLNALTFIVCLAMMIIPTYIITRITPVKAIRFH